MPQIYFRERSLKHSVLAVTLLALSTLAQADLGELHARNCEAPEVKTLMGKTGSCRVVVAPKKIETLGSCSGTFMGQLACVVTFAVSPEGAAMNLTCAKDPNNPVINQDMEAEGSGYNVATLVRRANGQDLVINDRSNYALINNKMVEVVVSESIVNNVPIKTGAVTLNLQSGPVNLQDVTCR